MGLEARRGLDAPRATETERGMAHGSMTRAGFDATSSVKQRISMGEAHIYIVVEAPHVHVDACHILRHNLQWSTMGICQLPRMSPPCCLEDSDIGCDKAQQRNLPIRIIRHMTGEGTAARSLSRAREGVGIASAARQAAPACKT